MSWGGYEFASETDYDSYCTTPVDHVGVTFLAATGDSGRRGVTRPIRPTSWQWAARA